MRKNAYRMGREMIWEQCGQMYMRFLRVSRLEVGRSRERFLATKDTRLKGRGSCRRSRLNHLSRMTDRTGVFQHAHVQRSEFLRRLLHRRYARLFILAVLLSELGEDPEGVRALATTSAAFLITPSTAKKIRFHNHISFDRRWLDRTGIGGLPRTGALGAGNGRGTFAIPKFSERWRDNFSRWRCPRFTGSLLPGHGRSD